MALHMHTQTLILIRIMYMISVSPFSQQEFTLRRYLPNRKILQNVVSI